MKIRLGFVSNSSSSSFIVEFKKVPETKKELQKILFGNRKEYHSPYSTEYYSTDQVADIVWNDLKDQKPATKTKIKETLRNGWPMSDDMLSQFVRIPEPKLEDFKKGNDYDWKAYKKARDRFCDQFMIYINEKAIDEKRVFLFEYNDDGGSMRCAMEHGDLFQNCQSSFRVSNH